MYFSFLSLYMFTMVVKQFCRCCYNEKKKNVVQYISKCLGFKKISLSYVGKTGKTWSPLGEGQRAKLIAPARKISKCYYGYAF